jgi:hypothetical protein
MTSPCVCMECRIRAAIHGDGRPPSEPFACDIGEALMALGEVMSELLAHTSTKSAKTLVGELLVARKKWQREPRIAVQQPAAGNA